MEAVSGLISFLSSENCSIIHEAFENWIIYDKGVNDAVSQVYSLLETAISENLTKKHLKAPSNSYPSNEWFDDECKLRNAILITTQKIVT